jgi:hydroxymethylglutaryl-CoA reductase
MNGVIAVALAFAQDHRAIEAGAHAYAVRDGQYKSLSKWSKGMDGELIGEMTLPMAIGLIGGAVSSHSLAQVARKILRVDNATELAKVMCAVGLAQNLGALRALTQEGIQEGHMKLHARNLVLMTGADPEIIDKAVEMLVESGEIRFPKAQDIVKKLRKSR